MIPDISVFDCSVKIRPTYVRLHFPELYEILVDIPAKTFQEKIYWYYNNITEHPKCEVCGSENVKFISIRTGYKSICCQSCGGKSERVRKKMEETKINRYGTLSMYNKEKVERTLIERYGSLEEAKRIFVERQKATLKERYGDENYFNREKSKETCLAKYGTEYAIQSKEVRDKIKKTNTEKYGVDCVLKRESPVRKQIDSIVAEKYGDGDIYIAKCKIAEKTKQTLIERYGVENPNNAPQAKENRIKTSLERYGVEHPMQSQEIHRRCSDAKIQTFLNNSEDVISSKDGIWVCRCPHKDCNKCEEKTYTIHRDNYWGRHNTHIEKCTKLLPVKKANFRDTTIEMIVQNLLDKYGVSYKKNERSVLKGKELDIYIPSLKIGIECNGIYWHSTKNILNEQTHFEKLKLCRAKNIRLISLWEDWIVTKTDIVESILQNKLGLCHNKVFARKCKICDLDSKTYNTFLQDNHIQGRAKSTIRYGLVCDGELVCVMGFLEKQNGEYELSRFCTKKFLRVVGGAEKLLKNFISIYHPNSVVSFAMNDISDGGLYKKLGFCFINEQLTYWYIDRNTLRRFHKSSFSKTNMFKKGLITEEQKNTETEKNLMENTIYYRIYDTGISKYELILNNEE